MSTQKSFIASLALTALTVSAQTTYPSIQASVDGVPTTLYVQYPSWSDASVSMDQSEVSYDFNNRMYLSTSPTVDTSAYFTPDMLGGYVEYEVDLSGVGCGCLSAFYGVVMPGVDNDQDPFQYCGAGSSASSACPEFDIMEANKYGFRSTSHKCDPADENGIFSQCDSRGQCTVDVLRQDGATVALGDYGPGSAYTIDTTQEFTVRADYQESDSRWTAFTITLTQGTDQVVMTAGDCTYLQGMSYNVSRGMAFVLSNWGPQQLDWVQHGTCSGQCDRDNVLTTFKNLRFFTSGAIESYDDYTVYQYGNKCGAWQDSSECDQACENCHNSWPNGDALKAQSPDSKCRCMPKQRAPHGYTYGANQCATNNGGICDGCNDCRWSWPTDDADQWFSAEALCRCVPEDQEISFGGQCNIAYAGECGADCQACHWSWPSDDTDKWASSMANCRCPADEIKEVVFGGSCGDLTYGQCGSYCRECRWSWLATDEDKWAGDSADCRCKNWWGA